MKGLLRKIFVELRWPVFFMGLGLALIMALLTVLLPKVLQDIDQVFRKLPFIKPLLSALLNVDLSAGINAQMTQAFLWVHPTVLALTWAHAMLYSSRMPAGEIDNGSIDFLLGLPVSRWKLYATEAIGFILSGCVLLSIGFTGHLIASATLQPSMRPGAYATFGVMMNFLAVYCAVGGMAFLVSTCCDRRARAVGAVFAILLVSFLLTFLAQFWDAAKPWSVLSVMKYYRPAAIIQSGEFPWKDTFILMTIAAVTWTIGGVVFRRRSICTV